MLTMIIEQCYLTISWSTAINDVDETDFKTTTLFRLNVIIYRINTVPKKCNLKIAGIKIGAKSTFEKSWNVPLMKLTLNHLPPVFEISTGSYCILKDSLKFYFDIGDWMKLICKPLNA